MGSPVSAVVANLYMEFFEEEICRRHFFKKGSEKHLLDQLNSIRPSIKFTMESEEDSKLPFLDCLLKRESDGVLTSTDRYIHFKSHHPNHVNRGIVRCLYQRI